MEKLASLMKTADDIHITKKERKYLLREAINILGEKRQLLLVIEEISELINVLSDNIMDDFDYLHTAEEITDVMIGIRTVSMIADVAPPKVPPHRTGRPRMKIINWYSKLSKAQQYISKYIRNGPVAREKLLMALDIMNTSTAEITEFCGIYKKDISKIETLKFKRLQDRIRNNDLK